jgi:ABC-type sugar transport system permease subunit
VGGTRFRPTRIGWAPYVFLAPFVVLFATFVAYPVVASLQLSLYQSSGLGDQQFVGLDNYRHLIIDRGFRDSLFNTLYFAAGTAFVQLPLAMLLALGLNAAHPRLLRDICRLAFFVPYITSAVVVAFMFALVFDTRYGLINEVLRDLHLSAIPWLTSTTWAMPALIILGLWTWTGVNALYFLGGLQGIPPELLEAAQLDGASPLQRFLHVIIPQLRPVILFVFTIGLIGSFHLFTQPFVLTHGGPGDSTTTMTMYLYEQGFRELNFGYAAAIGYAIVVLVGAAALLQIRIIGGLKED